MSDMVNDSLVSEFMDEVLERHGANDGYFTKGQVEKAAGIVQQDKQPVINSKMERLFSDAEATYELHPAIVQEDRQRVEDRQKLRVAVAQGTLTPALAEIEWQRRHGTAASLAEVQRQVAEAAWAKREVSDPVAIREAHMAFERTVREELMNDREYQKLSNILATLQAMREEF